MAFNRDKRGEMPEDNLDEHTVFINRCAKTVKGGRRMSFSAVIVVGDKEGKVGVGFGKANEVADAIRKGGEAARKAMKKIVMKGKTIPHDVEGVCDGGRVILKPATPSASPLARRTASTWSRPRLTRFSSSAAPRRSRRSAPKGGGRTT